MKSALLTLAFATLLAAPLSAQKTEDVCKACHEEHVTQFQSHKHAKNNLSCDACHGESVQHREANGAVAVDKVAAPHEVPALCGGCHTAQLKDYAGSKHGKLVMAKAEKKAANCGICHGVHSLRTAKQTMLQCNRCHATFPDAHPKFAADTLCWTCHQPHTLVVKK